MMISRRLFYPIFALGMVFALAQPLGADSPGSRSDSFREKGRKLAEKFPKENRDQAHFRLHQEAFSIDRQPAKLGEEVSFQIDKTDNGRKKPVRGILRKIGEHCYIYLEKGLEVNDGIIEKIGNTFDKTIYPTNRRVFGEEWNPGVDGDPRITLFLVSGMTGCDGYFDPEDEYTREKCRTSNEREMLVLATERLDDPDSFLGHLVAHEFQHMIHWNHDPKEVNWVDEGLAEYASTLYSQIPFTIESFFKYPNRSLIDWSDSKESANYGNVFLFMNYLINNGGIDEVGRQKLIRAIVNSQGTGIAGVSSALAECKVPLNFSELFRAFSAATFLNKSFEQNPGSLGFDSLVSQSLEKIKENPLKPKRHFNAPVGRGTGKLKAWSAISYSFSLASTSGEIRFSFSGSSAPTVKSHNFFDVGVAFVDGQKKLPPNLQWLKMRNNEVDQSIAIPTDGFEEMLLIICNRGANKLPANEKRIPPNPFSFTVTSSAITASNRNRASSLPDRTIVSALVDSASEGEPNEQIDREIINAVHSDLETGSSITQLEIEKILSIGDPSKRKNLVPLIKQVEHAVRFYQVHKSR